MTGLHRDAHVTPARWQLGWLTTEMRQLYFSGIIVYKARHIGQPKHLADLFNTYRLIDVGRGDAIPELDLPYFEKFSSFKNANWYFREYFTPFIIESSLLCLLLVVQNVNL